MNLHDLRARLGGNVYDGGKRWVGPGPGHSRGDRSLSLKMADGGRLVIWSFVGDSLADCRAHLGLAADEGHPMTASQQRREREGRKAAEAAERVRKLAHCRRVWESSLPAQGSPVEAYLRGRDITCPIPPALRFHPFAPLGYDGRRTVPAMVAMVTNLAGKSCGLHLTALRPDGSGKADMSNPKLMFGVTGGGAVRLADGPNTTGTLMVTEGIETGLSASLLFNGLPTWACLSASGLKTFVPPRKTDVLLVAADGDKAGLEALQVMQSRRPRSYECHGLVPAEGEDWNDVLREGRKPAFVAPFGCNSPFEALQAAGQRWGY